MGQAKICVKCPTEAEMYDIQAKAQAAGLVNHLVVRRDGCNRLLRVCWFLPFFESASQGHGFPGFIFW